MPDKLKTTEMRSDNESIKKRLTEAIRTCMRTTSVENITVRQITEVAGLSRQSFYRTFQDKYELINWYLDKILVESFEHMGDGKNVYDALVHKFTYIRQERDFFAVAFESDAQNNIKEHDFEMIFAFYKNFIITYKGNLKEKFMVDLLEMYCIISIYRTAKWVTSGTPESPEELASLLIEAMPAKLAALFEELRILN